MTLQFAHTTLRIFSYCWNRHFNANPPVILFWDLELTVSRYNGCVSWEQIHEMTPDDSTEWIFYSKTSKSKWISYVITNFVVSFIALQIHYESYC